MCIYTASSLVLVNKVVPIVVEIWNRLESADRREWCYHSKLVKALFSRLGKIFFGRLCSHLRTRWLRMSVVECVSQRRWFFKLQQVGIRMNAVLVAMIYNKGLTLSCQSKQSHTSGEIINFMTVDAERVGDFSWYMHDPWMSKQSHTSGEIINFMTVDAERLLSSLLFCYVGKYSFGENAGELQDKLMESKDTRMKATSEILRNMRILKLQGWEMKFLSKIFGLRNVEEGWCPARVRQDPVCTCNIQADAIEKRPRGSSDIAVEITDGNFSWDLSSPTATLKDINLKVFHGMSVAVCGTVGSGKSSLLSCVLGELTKISGTLKLCDMYDKVLEACNLKKDLEILSFGDQTVIGERGINLSGGQKQRVQIARALYQDADIYLFDDPFSAVDAHTGSHLFKEVLLNMSKTVIFTHQVEFLPAADLILVMKDGRIVQAGKYNDILSSGTDFMELVGAHNKALSALDNVEKEENQGNESGKVDDVGPKGQLVQEEEREKGKVGFSVYWKYITTAYGGALVPLILLAQILFRFFKLAATIGWLGDHLCRQKAMLLNTAGYKTATLLFKKMHSCIFRAPMSFFDSTPSGRILNRASTDQSAVDMNIPYQVGAFAFSVIQLLGIIAVMSQVAWQIFVIFIPVIATCIWYQQYYISSARELSRLVGVSKAPLIQHFAETILGATTIRSFDQEKRFQDTNMELTDSYSRPKISRCWCNGMAVLPSGLIVLYYFRLLVILFNLFTGGTIAGLAVTYGLNLNILQAWVVWNICNMENKIISVERILQYSSIPSEPALVIETNRPDHRWPYHGEVRYAPHMPLVLRGLTCTFPGGLKTGIVGRTGSGKSTLIQTLFRIVEPTAGQIIIDGVNISSVGLLDLRTRLSIIPQEPTMFEGTIRSNLDPLEEYTDEQIWEALDKCQLGDGVRLKEGRLDSSASVDTATDNLIQTTLREHFSDCTVITIAHRITSVLDSDMVLLLSHGLIEEYDTPSCLLENKSSSFAQLVAEYTARSDSGSEKSDRIR
ncbi:ABC transporter C family member 7 [Hibiscus syriacus]|uniref:ABC-type xenobiotic transporter n=1 Tax=Hibiscus syriacus TaxID=106335 RepID=A0A6A2YZB1_HIBSY|nr:ABC transporter C family member 7 [Hibiscus syriacus]